MTHICSLNNQTNVWYFLTFALHTTAADDKSAGENLWFILTQPASAHRVWRSPESASRRVSDVHQTPFPLRVFMISVLHSTENHKRRKEALLTQARSKLNGKALKIISVGEREKSILVWLTWMSKKCRLKFWVCGWNYFVTVTVQAEPIEQCFQVILFVSQHFVK